MVERKWLYIYLVLPILLLIFFVADVLLGSEIISLSRALSAFSGEDASYVSAILFRYRIPKALTALAVGVALSISGLQMQTVFRNPLADPYILGVSSGAGLGVAMFLLTCNVFGISILSGAMQNLGHAFAACIGAAAVMLVMLFISARLRDIMAMLILGMMIGSAAGALVSLLQYFSDAVALKSYVMWTMGSVGNVTNLQLAILLSVVLLGIIFVIASIKTLNVLMIGEDYARSLGYNVKKSRTAIIVAATVMTGVATAFCGPVGFIGVAVPHVARMILHEADHRYLVPATMLLGGVTMLFCDVLSQLPGQQASLPVNTVTALLGIPVVVLVIMRNQKIV
ncbi:MAG: iron ABC transporter permease [Prevotellaceae bacterium]|jgi:iron complex transport system permease protein|nr:iron ABC transporter permease [Prevotellaceae bacterium]